MCETNEEQNIYLKIRIRDEPVYEIKL
jgi:hypothetical protein